MSKKDPTGQDLQAPLLHDEDEFAFKKEEIW